MTDCDHKWRKEIKESGPTFDYYRCRSCNAYAYAHRDPGTGKIILIEAGDGYGKTLKIGVEDLKPKDSGSGFHFS